MSSAVSRPHAANSQAALKHFQSLLEFETDCWDAHHAISNNSKDFMLLDLRNEQAYKMGQIVGSINLPYSQLSELCKKTPHVRNSIKKSL